MPFWLARRRDGQDEDAIQRFDPRFWTVNFPRPMMASVVTTAPDALRVECEFYHEGELAGLIWASEDVLDHPLLRYATDRDYSRTMLQFRWRSAGIVPLDQPNGPTLTIEGRDASGAARVWYVRLWNYAVGTPEDAIVTLRFSDLQSGYVLPGEPVHPADIDRMFVSLVPVSYVPESTTALPARSEGWAEMSDIACHGERAMLTIGDVMLPAHGEGIATAYDDSFNQTPARLLRTIEALGYRDRIVHYVGMSHYFRLEPVGRGHYVSLAGGVLSHVCEAWHRAFAAEAMARDFTVIWSLSYEVFDAHCWNDWKQRAHDGSPALTGWEPPSTLLSPAHDGAMDYLRQVAAAFVQIALDAGMPVEFQIGEPWWWVQPQGRKPCLYDAAAQAVLPSAAPITDMRQPMDAEQLALLDAAGALLAQSTARLAQAVRNATLNGGGGAAEILLLAFTPTVLDPEMPELKRVNLPVGWAHPAFDRLQLEDYDWLTDGATAARRAGYALVQARLSYPLEKQDYLSGFVLLAEDADLYWRRIDKGLDEARRRGVPRRYVWALPQVARDGYTRLPRSKDIEETSMTPFDDVAYPLALGRDASVSPEFSTAVTLTASGHERRNALWSDARLRFDVGPGIRSEEELGTLIAFFRARHGPARGFRLRDPFDFSSRGMTGTPTAFDQIIATGDGLASEFALIKTYDEQVRRITRPVAGSILVSVDGVPTTAWELGESGTILLDSAPSEGAIIRAGFFFDVPVRFAEDRIDVSGLNFAAGEAPSIPLIELREETFE